MNKINFNEPFTATSMKKINFNEPFTTIKKKFPKLKSSYNLSLKNL